MKKIILALMIVSVMVAGGACSKSTDVEESSSVSSISESGSESNEDAISMFGKVTSITGNEIELEIAEPPFDNDTLAAADSSVVQGEEFVYEWNGDEELPGGVEGSVDGESVGTIIAISGEDGEMQIIGADGGEKMDLKYTGESKSIIIPAGTEIMNMIGGPGSLDDIKKGSVLMLGVDDANASVLKALNVLIME